MITVTAEARDRRPRNPRTKARKSGRQSPAKIAPTSKVWRKGQMTARNNRETPRTSSSTNIVRNFVASIFVEFMEDIVNDAQPSGKLERTDWPQTRIYFARREEKPPRTFLVSEGKTSVASSGAATQAATIQGITR